MKYNRSEIMRRAWRNHRKGLTFGEAQHRALLSEKAQPINAERIETAKAAAGVNEKIRTWADWKRNGYEVRQLFKIAYLDDTIDRNPMDKVQRPKPRKDEKNVQEVEAFTADELKNILSCMEREPLKWQSERTQKLVSAQIIIHDSM